MPRPMPNLPGIFRVALVWAPAGRVAMNVFHVASSATTSEGVYTILNGSVTAAMWGLEITGIRVNTVQIYNLGDQSAMFESSTTGPQWGGSNAGTEYSGALAGVLSLTTTLRGPANRGRMYLPFVSETSTANGELLEADRAAVEAAWNAFRLALPAQGSSLQVASYGVRNAEGEFLPNKAAHSTPVVNIQCHLGLGTQRGRQMRYYS